MNQYLNKIVLITTPGCEGCYIAQKNIEQAINRHSKKVSFERMTDKDFGLKRLSDMKIRDFPAIIFFKGDKIVFKHVGTAPVIMFLRWIDVWF